MTEMQSEKLGMVLMCAMFVALGVMVALIIIREIAWPQ